MPGWGGRLLGLVCLAGWLGGAEVRGADSVFISEFMASNHSGLKDEDGDYSDWIELSNPTASTVNLGGWFLTDAAGNLTKWRLPATNLPPSGFLVVFASGKDRAVAGRPLHTDFSLSAGGEYLALVKPDGVTVASAFSPRFPDQYQDVSYGVGQLVRVTRFVPTNAAARVYVPTNATLGLTWVTNTFNDTAWTTGTNGIGYELDVPGFSVRNVLANASVCDYATAEAVLADPSFQAAVFTGNPQVINYLNTSSDAHFSSGATFPGLSIGTDRDNFVLEATGRITIPTSTNWTFGVNSDDGFRLTIGTNSLEYTTPRGPGDTLATFFLAAGDYPVRLVFFECGGGSEVEFFAARGSYSAFGSVFTLVGATNGLAVKCAPGANGIGGILRPLIRTDVQGRMWGRSSSAYVRVPFVVTNPAAFTSLTLRAKYNDGLVAYLNGTEVARRNFSGTPQWNSVASAARPVSQGLVYEDIDVSAYVGRLRAGTNVLALHGLNESASGGQFLALAELVENKFLGVVTNFYFGTPTPGAPNGLETVAYVSDLKFTPNRGWYFTSNVSVTITSATPNVTIRYTTNGSAPTVSSGSVYTGPIPLAATTVLRAIGYAESYQPTPVETHSYIFPELVRRQSTNVDYVGGSAGDYTLNTAITQTLPYRDTFTNDLLALPTLSLSLAYDDFFGPGGIWSNPEGQGVAWERPCSAEYFRPDGKGGFHVNCGLRIQGGVSRTAIPKHSLRLLFKSAYGPGKLDYNLFPDSSVKEFDTLSLHASFNDHWLWVGSGATLHRDLFCRETQNAMGGFAGHGTYAHLYINGLYWGVYNLGERSDDAFAASYLGGEKEDYDARTADEPLAGTDDAWNALLSLASTNIQTDAAYTNVAQYLDIPNFADYLLMNFYAANTDWPWHNWTAARRRAPNAGFHFFSWDAEWVLGVNNDINTDLTGLNAEQGALAGIYAALRSHPEFRRIFGDRAQKHCFNGGALTPAAVQGRWEGRSAELNRAIVCETARWGGGYTRESWLAAEDQVRAWFPQRTATLVRQLRAAGLYPLLEAPAMQPFGGLVAPTSTVVLSNPAPAGTVYYTFDGTDPRQWGGGLASSARAYAGPLALTNAAFIRARTRDGTNWSALVEASFYVVQDYQGLVVSELMYNPPNFGLTNGDQVEYLELQNTASTTLDLSGLSFTEGITFTFTNGTRLAPGQFFLLARDPAALGAKYPGVKIDGIYTGKLDNAGERLTLTHPLGFVVWSLTYSPDLPWPLAADGLGFSLVRTDPAGDPNLASSWRASAQPGGSPRAADPPAPQPPVVINEVLTHTALPLVDAIELLNLATTNVDIGGWFLSDDPAVPMKFRVPAGTRLAPGGFRVFTAAEFNPVPGAATSFGLSSWGEGLYLFSGGAGGQLTGYSHGLKYGPAAEGVSFGRYQLSTGEEQWPAQLGLTLGTNNVGPRVGPVVINEIHYHPGAGQEEFVELCNLSSAAVPLFDPEHPENGWRLRGLGYTFAGTSTLPAGGFLLLVPIDPAAFRAKYAVPSAVAVFGPYTGALQGNGESLVLERPGQPDTNGVPYIVVDEVHYRDHAPWPASADGDGPSLQRLAPDAYGNEPTNWFASGITPGLSNTFNQSPWCALTAPTNGTVVVAPAAVGLRVSAADPDGLVRRVEYYDGEVLIGMATNAPFTLAWTNAGIGAHLISAKAIDNRLAVYTSAAATLTVEPPPAGTGTGVRGDYFDNQDFTGTWLQRVDPNINFNWGEGAPAASMGVDSFSVRWTGKVQPRYTGTYTFYTVSDDGVRLWVNNQLLINNWTDHAPAENAGYISLVAGRIYDLKLEFFENGGGAVAQLLWSAPWVTKEPIPTTQLYVPSITNQPPVVSLLTPGPGDSFVTGTPIRCTAAAFDPDGAVAQVQFYANNAFLGTGSAAPYEWAWTNAALGAYTLSAVVTDNAGLSRTSAPVRMTVVAGVVTNVSLTAKGADWDYNDTGTEPGADWSWIRFAGAGWSLGPAPLGYGNGGESTVVGYGPNPGAKFITTWFRHPFVVSDPFVYEGLSLNLLAEDGAAVYLNGSQVWLRNLPAGPLAAATTALTNAVGPAATNQFQTLAIDPGYLVPGTNVLAVEVHLFSNTAPALRFDLELTGTRTFFAPALTVAPASQTVLAGSNVLWTAAATGTSPLAWQWRFNGQELPGATTATLALPGVDPAQAGDYTVVVSNPGGACTSAVAHLIVRLPDRDGDGMPDAWETAHGLNPEMADANLDPDGDGLTNLQEYLAGTDPQDAGSCLRLEWTTAPALRLGFQTISNRTYQVQTALQPDAGWSALTNISAAITNRTVLLPITPISNESYYRVVTPAP